MARGGVPKPPTWLGKIAKAKFRELARQMGDRNVEADALALLANSWEIYLTAVEDLQRNGVVLTNTANGRTWNNPAVNTAATAWKEILKLSRQLGLWEPTDAGDEVPIPQ